MSESKHHSGIDTATKDNEHMKTRNDLRRLLQDAFDKIEFICCHGDFYSGLEATGIAHDAYVLACRHGCVIEMSKLKTDHDALRLVGRLLAWAEQAKTPGDMPEGMLNLAQASAYLGCTVHGLRKVITRTQQSREGQYIKGPTIEFFQQRKWSTILFKREWLDEYIERNHLRAGSPKQPTTQRRRQPVGSAS